MRRVTQFIILVVLNRPGRNTWCSATVAVKLLFKPQWKWGCCVIIRFLSLRAWPMPELWRFWPGTVPTPWPLPPPPRSGSSSAASCSAASPSCSGSVPSSASWLTESRWPQRTRHPMTMWETACKTRTHVSEHTPHILITHRERCRYAKTATDVVTQVQYTQNKMYTYSYKHIHFHLYEAVYSSVFLGLRFTYIQYVHA